MTSGHHDLEDNDEGLGAQAGPDFAAPGSVPADPSPSNPSNEPAVHASPTPEYGDLSTVGLAEPPARPVNRRPLIIILSAIVIIVLAIVVGAWVGNRTSQSQEPESPPFTPMPPQEMTGPGFRFTSPEGWARSPEWGSHNDGQLVDSAGNDITIYIFENGDAGERCSQELRSLEVWEPGEITDLPGRKVDGRPAPGGQLTGERTYQLRCVQANSAIYNLTFESANEDLAAVEHAYTAVLDGWKWD